MSKSAIGGIPVRRGWLGKRVAATADTSTGQMPSAAPEGVSTGHHVPTLAPRMSGDVASLSDVAARVWQPPAKPTGRK